MARLLIFTAGTSLLENLENPQKLNRSDLTGDAFPYGGSGAWFKVLRRPEEIRKDLVKYAGFFLPYDLADLLKRGLATAETASLYLTRTGQEESEDRLVLLCSDTGPGAFCALANGMLLGKEVRYYPEPGYYRGQPAAMLTIPGLKAEEAEVGMHPALLAVRLPHVEVVGVQDLDASRPDSFQREAIPALIKTIARLHYEPTSEARETILNYTAGFKAAIPTLTQAAALVGSITVQCLFEEASALITQPLMQIQLRPLAEERLLWAGENSSAHPDPLRDYASLPALEHGLRRDEWVFYDEGVDSKPVLSDLGLAMRELLRAKNHRPVTGP